MSGSDTLYASTRSHLVDFAFDESVASVFPDMIRRSVPGYETIISSLAVIASQYYRPGTRIYDLGCSLGAATLATWSQLGNTVERYVALDNSAAMLEKCRQNLNTLMPDAALELELQDIRNAEVKNASVVILNFTLQFVPKEDRQDVLERLYGGLVPGGALILSEKISAESDQADRQLVALYHRFKSANGYSDLEISQKRTALENVMQLDRVSDHHRRLEQVGFASVIPWYQCFNFVSLLAIK